MRGPFIRGGRIHFRFLRIQSFGQIQYSGDILNKSNSNTRETDKMAKASWGGKVIAESNATVVVEGNPIFPARSR